MNFDPRCLRLKISEILTVLSGNGDRKITIWVGYDFFSVPIWESGSMNLRSDPVRIWRVDDCGEATLITGVQWSSRDFPDLSMDLINGSKDEGNFGFESSLDSIGFDPWMNPLDWVRVEFQIVVILGGHRESQTTGFYHDYRLSWISFILILIGTDDISNDSAMGKLGQHMEVFSLELIRLDTGMCTWCVHGNRLRFVGNFYGLQKGCLRCRLIPFNLHHSGNIIIANHNIWVTKYKEENLEVLDWQNANFHFFYRKLSFSFRLLQRLSRMMQSNLINNVGSGKKVEMSLKRLKITVPHFDNSSLIEGYSKTLIGRCMNPAMQDMKILPFMLPKIWKVEERVAGADLGLGRFQFDFDREVDILEVMKMEPFHFDYWMLSLVRWEPVVDMKYPFAIRFWVRVLGVPLHFWAYQTFRCIGEALGDVKAVNLDEGKVQVVVDGFKPLCFETIVEFQGGVETTVSLRYERLFGFCKTCSSLCHDHLHCPSRGDIVGHKGEDHYSDEPRQGSGASSYKAATVYGLGDNNEPAKRGIPDQAKGKGKMTDSRHQFGSDYRHNNMRVDRKNGEGSRYNRSSSYLPPKDLQKRYAASVSDVDKRKYPAMGQVSLDFEKNV